MRRWRAITARATVLLSLGAILNVAVAWGCVVTQSISIYLSFPVEMPVSREDRQWLAVRRAHFMENYPLTACSRFAIGYSQHRVSEAGGADMFSRWIERHLAGWPLKSMCGEIGWIDGWRETQGASVLNIWDVGKPKHYLPLMPILPGFAINTVCYAAVLWGIFAAPFALRRRRRIKRGLCPKCAYPVRGAASDVCSECGATLRSGTMRP